MMSNNAFVVTKEQMAQRIRNLLELQGYSESEEHRKRFVAKLRRLLGGKTAWNPDIFLLHQNKTVLVADVQLIEDRSSQYIPSAMEHAAPKIISNFHSVQVVLYIPMGGNVQPNAIQNAAKLKIAIQSVDQSGTLHRLLDPSTVGRSFGISEQQKAIIKDQKTSGWLVPRVLVKKLLRSRNLEYSTILRKFARDYLITKTPVSLSTQYKLVCQCINSIFTSYNLDHCCGPLQISKELQKMARWKGESRDHFLHEFQTFLIGALILDHCAKSPLGANLALCGSYPKLDLPWLLASIFHDFGFDLVNLESPLNIDIATFSYESRGNHHFSTLLNSFFDFRRTQNDLDNWDLDRHQVASSDLQRILFDAALEKHTRGTGERLRVNHGVVSSHEIIKLGETLPTSISGQEPIFASSAFSAALHDKALWAELFAYSILPADASRFPLFYLLVICDTLAEAGRPTTTNIREQDAILASFRTSGNKIYASIWFSNRERACMMNFWVGFVQSKCFNNPILEFKCRSLHTI